MNPAGVIDGRAWYAATLAALQRLRQSERRRVGAVRDGAPAEIVPVQFPPGSVPAGAPSVPPGGGGSARPGPGRSSWFVQLRPVVGAGWGDPPRVVTLETMPLVDRGSRAAANARASGSRRGPVSRPPAGVSPGWWANVLHTAAALAAAGDIEPGGMIPSGGRGRFFTPRGGVPRVVGGGFGPVSTPTGPGGIPGAGGGGPAGGSTTTIYER